MVALDDYYEKGSMVLLFIPQDLASGDMAPVNELIDQQNRIEGENAHFVAISSQPFADLYQNQNLAFPLLVDAGGSIRASYTNLVAPGLVGKENIFIFILDTYGAPQVCLVGKEPGEDFVNELLSWLLYISIQCPE
jgi:peroxiredoxin